MSIDISILLASGAVYTKVKKGETIFTEGGHCRFYHQLVSGSIRWLNIDEQGREFVQNIILPGECFGELPLFDDRPYAASAIACEDSVVIRLAKQTFLQLLKEDFGLHLRFDKIMADRIRFKFFLQKTMVHHSPEERITSLFNYMKEEKRHICPHCHQIKLTRQQIADITGLRVETVIRVIRKMHEEGLLNIEKGKVFYGPGTVSQSVGA